MSDTVEILDLLPELKRKMVGSSGDHYSRSYLEVSTGTPNYSQDQSKKMTDMHWLSHFKQQPDMRGGRQYGSFALSGVYIGDRGRYLKWICFDADDDEKTGYLYDLIIPHLDKHGFPFLLEHGGDQLERRKLWIFFDECLFSIAHDFVGNMLAAGGLKRKDFEGEIYPRAKPEGGEYKVQPSLLRIPGGYYPKRKRTFPVEYQGRLTIDPVEVIKAIIECPVVSEQQVLDYLAQNRVAPILEVRKKVQDLPESFRWIEMNLPLPVDPLPADAEFLCKNCPAYNHLITETAANKMIDKAGGLHHDAGVCLSGLGQYIDWKTKSSQGEKWFDSQEAKYRSRDAKSHNWKWDWGKRAAIWTCATMEDTFDACGGCAHKGLIHSPRQLATRPSLEKTRISDVFLTTPEWIRDNTFPKVRRHIHELLAAKEKGNILLKSPMGSGKSFFVDELTANLAKLGYTTIIAVPTADLAMEHKNRLKDEWGVGSFALMSHEKLFDHIAKFDCPNYDGIHAQQKLGMSSAKSKREYCQGCKFKEDCPFPNQYKRAAEPEKKVLIIQHAHFSCKETLMQIMNSKLFDILFIDESFINSTFTDIKATEAEIAVLKTLGYQWTDLLAQWFEDGGYPKDKIDANETDRLLVEARFTQAGIVSRVPEFLRLYDRKEFYNLDTGVFDFHSVPEIPIKVFTDATPPQEMIEMVINQPLTVFGEGEVLDYRVYNERNEVIQVIDGSMSKTALKSDDYALLVDILSLIGTEGRERFPNDKILVTVYEDQREIAQDWLKANYPDVFARCTFSLMAVGTNAYASYNVQFLLAGIYIDSVRIPKEAYRLKAIKNHWADLGKTSHVSNILPDQVIEGEKRQGLLKKWIPVRKIHPEGLFEYNVVNAIPTKYYERMIHELDTGKTQQSIRLRFHSGEKKTVYVFGNMFLPSFLITEVRLLGQLLGY